MAPLYFNIDVWMFGRPDGRGNHWERYVNEKLVREMVEW